MPNLVRWVFKGCQFCQGDLAYEIDLDGWVWRCIQCSRTIWPCPQKIEDLGEPADTSGSNEEEEDPDNGYN